MGLKSDCLELSYIALSTFGYICVVGLFVLTPEQCDDYFFPPLPKLHGRHSIPGRYFAGLCAVNVAVLLLLRSRAYTDSRRSAVSISKAKVSADWRRTSILILCSMLCIFEMNLKSHGDGRAVCTIVPAVIL